MTSKILVIGAGCVGRLIAEDLAGEYEVHAVDRSREILEKLSQDVKTHEMDFINSGNSTEFLKGFDLVVNALPGRFGFTVLEDCIEAGKDVVDISFMPDDPLVLDEKAKEKDVTIVPDAGFGPGMSNVFVGRLADEIEELKEAKIRIGALPLEPQPPLFYRATWSVQDLIEEYTREARQFRDHEMVQLDPLEDIKEVELRDETFEEFYSDGLRTLLDTVEIKTLEETTLRWEGHLDKMKVLRDLGFFDEGQIENTLDVITPLMRFESDDFCLMDITGEGIEEGKKEKKIRYTFYDEATEEFDSIARTTGFPAALMSRLVLEEGLEKGVVPPEELGMKERYYDHLVSNLKKRGIEIERVVETKDSKTA